MSAATGGTGRPGAGDWPGTLSEVSGDRLHQLTDVVYRDLDQEHPPPASLDHFLLLMEEFAARAPGPPARASGPPQDPSHAPTSLPQTG